MTLKETQDEAQAQIEAEDMQQLIPEPLIFPDRRWKISISRSDVRRNIRIPAFVIVLGVLLLVFMFISTLVLFFGGSGRVDARKMQVLQSENARLKSKLDHYSAAVDSIFARLDSLSTSGDKALGKGGVDHPYVPPHPQGKLKDRAALERQFNDLDNKLTLLLAHVGADLPLIPQEVMPVVPAPQSGDGIPSIYPTFGVISSGFGLRIHPIYDDLMFHEGIDIANAIGTPIYATADGVVRKIDFDNGYGKRIFISHQDGYETQYGHLYSYQVREGDVVCKGQIIALMGNSGLSTGPHLHYAVLKDGDKINPSPYLNRIDTDRFAGR